MRITRALAPLGLLPLPGVAAAAVGIPLQETDTTTTGPSSSAPAPRQSGGGLKLCRDVSLVRSTPGRAFNDSLSATCQSPAKAEYVNALDLNHCVGVDPATLELGWARAGRLSSFCGTCDLSLEEGGDGGHVIVGQAVLSCACSDAGKELKSSVRLDDGGIEDKDGVLVCRSNGRRATAIRMNPDAIVRTEPKRCVLGDLGYMDCIPREYNGKIIAVGDRDKYGSKPNNWRGH